MKKDTTVSTSVTGLAQGVDTAPVMVMVMVTREEEESAVSLMTITVLVAVLVAESAVPQEVKGRLMIAALVEAPMAVLFLLMEVGIVLVPALAMVNLLNLVPVAVIIKVSAPVLGLAMIAARAMGSGPASQNQQHNEGDGDEA